MRSGVNRTPCRRCESWGSPDDPRDSLPAPAEILKRASDLAPADPANGTSWVSITLSRARSRMPLQRSKRLSPGCGQAEAYNSLGAVRLESGDLPLAEPAFREAIRIRPDYAEAHSNLGNVLSGPPAVSRKRATTSKPLSGLSLTTRLRDSITAWCWRARAASMKRKARQSSSCGPIRRLRKA